MGSLVGFRLCRLHVVFSACRVSVCFGAWSRAPQLDCCYSAHSLLVLTEYCALTNIMLWVHTMRFWFGEIARCAPSHRRRFAFLWNRIYVTSCFAGFGA